MLLYREPFKRRKHRKRKHTTVKFGGHKLMRKVSDLSAKLSAPNLFKTFRGGKEQKEQDADQVVRMLKDLDKEMYKKVKVNTQESHIRVDVIKASSSELWTPSEASSSKKKKKEKNNSKTKRKPTLL